MILYLTRIDYLKNIGKMFYLLIKLTHSTATLTVIEMLIHVDLVLT